MTNDEKSFLRAIADQPADRTARLVFADFLEETGDVVRADFIRTQVEAETIHPNSNRAAELESRARELFSAHWLDWWALVCEAVGLPSPYRPPSGVRGWIKRQVSSQRPPGFPYAKAKDAPGVEIANREPGPPLDVLRHVRFRGGFPEAVSFFGQPAFAAEFLRRWTDVSPLAALDLHGFVARDWRAIDGPHLSGLRELSLGQDGGSVLTAVAASPHLSRLEGLRLTPDRSNVHWPAEQYRTFADSPLAERVTRLSIVLADVSEALAFHGAPLGKITALEVRGPQLLRTREDFERAELATADLLSLPHFDRLEELTLDTITSRAVRSADRTLLGRLRKLDLVVVRQSRIEPLFDFWTLAPALTDLSISITHWSLRWFDALTRSSLLGRLRHLRLDGHLKPYKDGIAALLKLVRSLDADRLETLRLGAAVCPSPELHAALAEKFGDRARFK